LDVKDITVVVNYDFPKSFDDYIHRIGRTGRAGASGRSFSLLSYERDEGAMAELLINHLNSLG
jgi:ATP-dependent RNA helicase DDX5/DBP2